MTPTSSGRWLSRSVPAFSTLTPPILTPTPPGSWCNPCTEKPRRGKHWQQAMHAWQMHARMSEQHSPAYNKAVLPFTGQMKPSGRGAACSGWAAACRLHTPPLHGCAPPGCSPRFSRCSRPGMRMRRCLRPTCAGWGSSRSTCMRTLGRLPM